jgi:hypothetical protein
MCIANSNKNGEEIKISIRQHGQNLRCIEPNFARFASVPKPLKQVIFEHRLSPQSLGV